jgi:hypothetical protein
MSLHVMDVMRYGGRRRKRYRKWSGNANEDEKNDELRVQQRPSDNVRVRPYFLTCISQLNYRFVFFSKEFLVHKGDSTI